MAFEGSVIAWIIFGIVVPLIIVKFSFGRSLTVEVGQTVGGHGAPRRSYLSPDRLTSTPHPHVTTLYELLQHASKLYPASKKLFGYRSVIRVVEEEKEVKKVVAGKEITSKKIWKFSELSPYSWMTYKDVVEATAQIGSGLRQLGLKPKDKLTIFASTGKDWMIMAHSCFTQNITITTAYDTLGEEGLSFSLNEGEVTTLFTQADLLSMIPKIAPLVASLATVIYTGKADDASLAKIKEVAPQITVYQLEQVQKLGVAHPHDPTPPTPEDLCCIMYTSGSTGNPKGVMLAHSNIIAAVTGSNKINASTFCEADEVYLGYLPLAHVLEFTVEHYCMYSGIGIGYGSPRTLTDASVRNCKGDIRELRPSLMAGVPAVWETIRKGIVSKLSEQSPTKQRIFNLAFNLKWALIKLGLPTGFLDKAVFHAIQSQTGGRLKYALSGGAPLAPETQNFLTVCICQISQGYGMTETSGVIGFQGPLEKGILGMVGAPAPNNEVKLVAVENTAYHPSNPIPQGEVWTRGPSIMKGYYKQPQTTAETLTEDGWLMTGDIAEWRPDGSLAIIDRKKNLVKLAHGEYVALEKLESQYKTSAYVGNICLHAESTQNYVVGIINVVAIEKELRRFASSLGLDHTAELSDLCSNQTLNAAVLKDLKEAGAKVNFKPAEIIGAIVLTHEEWTPENGLLTAAQKLKRRDIVTFYSTQIKTMYGSK